MSQASSRSASSGGSGGGGGGGGYKGMGLPVPYRVGPFAYEPAVYCKCEVKAPRWISWSPGNPGRRYHRCRKARTPEDCGFFNWADDECFDWYKEVLKDLRDAVWDLKKEVMKKEALLNGKEMQLLAKTMEVGEQRKGLEDMLLALNHKQEELNAMQLLVEAKDADVIALGAKLKNNNQYLDILVLFSVSLVVMLVIMLLQGNKA